KGSGTPERWFICLLLSLSGSGKPCLDPAAREKRGLPNWALTSSDFFGWVENLRAHAGYDKMEDLARTFWAHFPPASHMGYESPEPEE
uniref:Si:ch73-23l24.1 n=1 Tax=Paramormyrops kingsleyae TaxID=1676925 RepID=A0A3B3SFW5_9TELE